MSEKVIVEQRVGEPATVQDKVAAGVFLCLVGSFLVGAIVGACVEGEYGRRPVMEFAMGGLTIAIALLFLAMISCCTVFAIGVMLR